MRTHESLLFPHESLLILMSHSSLLMRTPESLLISHELLMSDSHRLIGRCKGIATHTTYSCLHHVMRLWVLAHEDSWVTPLSSWVSPHPHESLLIAHEDPWVAPLSSWATHEDSRVTPHSLIGGCKDIYLDIYIYIYRVHTYKPYIHYMCSYSFFTLFGIHTCHILFLSWYIILVWWYDD